MGILDAIIHAGDYLRDGERLARLVGVPVIGVAGNGDPWPHPSEELIELGGHRFFIAHGHKYGVKTDCLSFIQKARALRVDAAIYGHTHVPSMFMRHGILFLNPGSTHQGRQGSVRSCAVVTIEDTMLNAAFLNLEKMPNSAH